MTENLNGDSTPQNLKRAFSLMHREVRKIRRTARRGRIVMPRGVTTEKLPRSLCQVCSRVWDFAMLPAGSQPTHGLCSDCKGDLRNGFTIFVCAGKIPLRAKDPILKADGVAGKIVRVSEDDYELLNRKMNGDGLSSEPDSND